MWTTVWETGSFGSGPDGAVNHVAGRQELEQERGLATIHHSLVPLVPPCCRQSPPPGPTHSIPTTLLTQPYLCTRRTSLNVLVLVLHTPVTHPSFGHQQVFDFLPNFHHIHNSIQSTTVYYQPFMTSGRDKQLPLPPGASFPNANGYAKGCAKDYASNSCGDRHGYKDNAPFNSGVPISPVTSLTSSFSPTTPGSVFTNSPPPTLSPSSSNELPTYAKIAHTFTPLSARPKDSKSASAPSPLAQLDPTTHLPTTFRINTSYTPPFVTIPHIVDHLTFLACLHTLQEDVRDAPFQRDDDKGRPLKPRPRNGFANSDEDEDDDPLIDGDVKWTAFCLRAAARFDLWATSESLLALADQVLSSGRPLVDRRGHTFLSETQLESVLAGVDIDVLMAWHTYMLNPSVYADDMERAGGERGKLRGLKALGAFPLSIIVGRAS